MEENLTSSEALQEETHAVSEVSERRKRNGSLGDTMTLQAILCVLMALGFVIFNILNGGLAADVFDVYKDKLCADGNIADVFAAVIDFLGSAPIDNV